VAEKKTTTLQVAYEDYYNAEVIELKEKLKSHVETIHSLTVELSTQDTENQAELQEQKDAFETIQKEIDEKDRALVKLSTQETESQAELREQRDAFKSIQKEIDEKDRALLSVKKHLQSKDVTIIELNKTVQENVNTLCVMKKEGEEKVAEKKTTTLQVAYEDYYNAEVIELKEKLKSHVETIHSLTVELSTQDTENQAELQEQKDAFETIQKEIDEKDRALVKLSTQETESQAELREQRDAFKSIQKEIDEKDRALLSVKKHLQSKDVTIIELNKTVQENVNTLCVMKKNLQVKESILIETEKIVDEKDMTIDCFKKDMQSKADDVTELNRTVQEHKAVLCEMKEDLQSKESSLIEIDKLSRKKDVAIVNLKKDLRSEEVILMKLKKNIEEKDNALLDMKKEMQINDDTVAQLGEIPSSCEIDDNHTMRYENTGTKYGDEATPSSMCVKIRSKVLVEEIENSSEKKAAESSLNSGNLVNESSEEVAKDLDGTIPPQMIYVDQQIKSSEFTLVDHELSHNNAEKEESIKSSLQHSTLGSSSSDTILSNNKLEPCSISSEQSAPDLDDINSRKIIDTKAEDFTSIGTENICKTETQDSSSDIAVQLPPTSRKNHSVLMKMPVGTTRASVAMAAVRAMRSIGNIEYGGLSSIHTSASHENLPLNTGENSPTQWGRNLRVTQLLSSSSSTQQELLGFRIKAKDLNRKNLGESHSKEISRLTKENTEYAEQVALLEQQLKNLDSALKMPEHSPITFISEYQSGVVIDLNETSPSYQQEQDLSHDINDSDDPSIVPQCQNLSSTEYSTENKLGEQKETSSLHKENKQLLEKVKMFEKEVDNVSALLAETIKAVKGKENEIESIKLLDGDKCEGGMFSRFITRKNDKSRLASEQPDTDMEHLVRVCKVHQFTVLKQRNQISKMQKTLEDNQVNLSRTALEAKSSEEKIAALENQFMELNEAKENNEIKSSLSNESLAGRGPSIIKIDAGYVSTLESDLSERSTNIKELRNQLNEEQARYSVLKEKVELTNDLHDEVATLSIQIKARDATISALEISYRLHKTECKKRPRTLVNLKKQEKYCNNLPCPETKSDTLCEKLAPVVESKLGIKEGTTFSLPKLMSSPEKCSKQRPIDAEKNTILSLRKVTLLQEMLDVSTTRLSSLLNRVEVSKNTDMNMPFVFSLCDKFTIMQDYIKLSLHLLQIKLSNELESIKLGKISGVDEDDETIQLRFDRTMESLCTSENKAEDLLEDLKKDIDHQEIKISAKDGVIEGLMRSENRLTLDIENLLSQLNILKSLSDYSSVNVGVIARFKEFSKIEDELREKERIIERLNNVIDEYRTLEDFTRCSDITV